MQEARPYGVRREHVAEVTPPPGTGANCRARYPGSSGSDASDRLVHPVGHGAERVVVERGHLSPVLIVPSGSMLSQRSHMVVAPIVIG